jgi:integrase
MRRPTKLAFGEFADQLLQDLSPQWRNEVHRQQWRRSIEVDAAALRDLALDAIDTDDVLKVLRPIWMATPATARRLRSRLETVLAAAKALGHRSGENPARWQGHLEHLLPRRARLPRRHHRAVPWQDMPAVITALRGNPTRSARAIVFLILTAARSGEVTKARWTEIDFVGGVWRVPVERMKAGAPHAVPLSTAAISLLSSLEHRYPSALLFPGPSGQRPLTSSGLLMGLRRVAGEGVTIHGFRSSFRDWAGEATDFPRELAEMALAHRVGDDAELAYRRGRALERRRALMEAWAAYLCG